MLIKKNKVYINLMILTITAVLLLFNNNHATSLLISYVILLLNFYTLIKNRKNWSTFIIFAFILWSNYSVCVANFISPIDSYFTLWKDSETIIQCMSILLVFSTIFAIVDFKFPENKIGFYDDDFRGNSVVVLFLSLVLAFIMVYGFSRPVEAGTRGNASALYEYSVVIFIVAFYYARKRVEKGILSILLFIFVLQDLIFGGRSTALQLLICWFLIFLAHKAKLKHVIPVGIVLLLVFSAVGALRGSILNLTSLADAAKSILNGKLTLDTAYSAFYTSATFIDMEAKISIFERLRLFGRFLLSMLLGGSAVSDSNLPEYTRQYYTHYYGGVLPFYFHFYLGYFGVVINAVYTLWVQKKLLMVRNDSKWKNLKKCLSIYFVCSIPRWYLYSPSPLVRGMIVFGIIYGGCYVINNLRSK